MLNSDQRNKVIKLLAKEVTAFTDSKDYSDLALYLLDSGYDSMTCRVLAGMQSAYKVEVEPYFRQLLEELGLLDLQYKEDYLILFLIEDYSKQVVSGSIDPQTALKVFYALWIKSEFDPKLSRFIEITDAIELIGSGYWLIPDLTIDNADRHIIATSHLLLLDLHEQLPENFYSRYFCPNCISLVESKRPGFFQRLSNPDSSVCLNCRRPDLQSCNSLKGQEAYLAAFGHNFD